MAMVNGGLPFGSVRSGSVLVSVQFYTRQARAKNRKTQLGDFPKNENVTLAAH